MRATILFVHGTGVRAAGYTATLDAVERQVARHGLDVDVRGCYWGEAEGAALAAGGASIPGYDESGGKQHPQRTRCPRAGGRQAAISARCGGSRRWTSASRVSA